jgi:hypothetical protein
LTRFIQITPPDTARREAAVENNAEAVDCPIGFGADFDFGKLQCECHSKVLKSPFVSMATEQRHDEIIGDEVPRVPLKW